MTTYTIKHKESGKFFNGFDKKDQPKWTADKSHAWTGCKQMATCQGLLLVKFGAQKKPVVL